MHEKLIGSPDDWHQKMAKDAIAAGKDVYLEKPVSRTLEDGDALLKGEGTKQVVQTGTQQRSWEHFVLGKQIVESGKLGQITFVHTYWHRAHGRGRLLPGDQAKLDWDGLARLRAGAALESRALLPAGVTSGTSAAEC